MPGLAHRPRVRLAVLPALRGLADAAAPVAAASIGLTRLLHLVAAAAPADRLSLALVVWAFVVALLLSALRSRTAYPGELVIAFVALHEVGRGWLEFVRVPAPDPVQQALAFTVAAVAGAMLVANRRASTAPRR